MQQLAAALATAVAYIEERITDGDLGADVAALEAIAFEIQNGSPYEQRAIAIVLSTRQI